MTDADEMRKTLREDGWAEGSLAFVQLDRALAEAAQRAAPRAEGPTGWRCWCGDRRDHALKVSTRYAAAHVGPDYKARATRRPRTAAQIHAAALGHPQQIGAPGCACDLRANDERRAYAEAAQGAAPRAEGLREALQAHFGEMLSPREYDAILAIVRANGGINNE